VVVSTLEWILTAIIVLGLVPAWLIGLAAFITAKQRRTEEPSARHAAYVRLLDALHQAIKTGTVENGAIYVAGVRELKAYPEYRDLSLLYLEEINITGTKKFDQIMKAEIGAVEAALLESRND
jgi:hypothetical protein